MWRIRLEIFHTDCVNTRFATRIENEQRSCRLLLPYLAQVTTSTARGLDSQAARFALGLCIARSPRACNCVRIVFEHSREILWIEIQHRLVQEDVTARCDLAEISHDG